MREGSIEAPTRHPVDWQNPDFYDEVKLDSELRRVFDICHGCRRCFNLCDSFPRLFDLIDASPSGEVHEVKSEDFKTVIDACTLCDLCFMTKCPYVPPHAFNLDFPHLMVRARAVGAKKGHNNFTDRALAKTDLNGMVIKYVAPIVNWITSTSNTFMRGVMETTIGVHQEAALPPYSAQTFVARASKTETPINRETPAYGKRKAVFYATCSINYNDPSLGLLMREVLAKNGVATETVYPSCCGMPKLEQGDIAGVVANACKVAQEFKPWIEDGYDVIALVPSCALMLKLEWPLLVPKNDPSYADVKKLADATYDITEYIVDLAQKEGLAPGAKPLAGPVALHLACHARAQSMGAKAADMLRLLPQSEDINVIERCSGHGGAWGIKKDNFEVALKVGKPVARKAAETLRSAEEKNQIGYIASECPLAGAHIVQGVERMGEQAPKNVPHALHPVEIFAMSYGITRDNLTLVPSKGPDVRLPGTHEDP